MEKSTETGGRSIKRAVTRARPVNISGLHNRSCHRDIRLDLFRVKPPLTPDVNQEIDYNRQ